MRSKLDVMKWVYASIAVFVLYTVLEFALNHWVLAPGYPDAYPASSDVQDVSMLRLYTYLGRAIFSLLFVYLFVRGYEGKPGIGEGARFGFWLGLLLHVPFIFYSLVVTKFGIGLLLGRGAGNLIETVLCGILANWVYARAAAPPKT